MLSRETLERYRQMTPGQRLKLTLQMTRENSQYLFKGDPKLVERRFELLRRQNNERNQAMLEALAKAEKRHEGR